MNVLLIGSGAREHAIAWKLRQSRRLAGLFCAPGNPGTAQIATNLSLLDSDLEGIVRACRRHSIDLAVIGNEEPLAAGLVDRLAVEGIAVFGPSRAAAEIESSKVFSKGLMARHGIPTSNSAVFENVADARAFVESRPGPFVVKADGLARGKGVTVTSSTSEAIDAIDAVLVGRAFGSSGDRVVIEDRISGPEVSAHAFTDGRTVVHMPFSCDHKPIFDGDRGPNTGGMGAYSPAAWLDAAIEEAIQSDVTDAAVAAMLEEGRPFRGVLYPGLMITDAGPMVIEFNCRFGDPEAQALLPRLDSDLLEIFWAVANNRLHEVEPRWSADACVAVALASGGYPGDYQTGFEIAGLDDLDADVLVFHAGTARDDRGRLVTVGGRVLTVSACGPTLEAAREKAYSNVARILFEGVHYRRDIGATASAGVRG